MGAVCQNVEVSQQHHIERCFAAQDLSCGSATYLVRIWRQLGVLPWLQAR